MFFENLRKIQPSSFSYRLFRMIWNGVWIFLFLPSPAYLFSWRRFLLRCFGAKIGKKVRVHPSARIWAPWKLEMDDFSDLGWLTDCYCVDQIHIGKNAMISQHSFLCTGNHDIKTKKLKLKTAPIFILNDAWIAADVFIGSGVTVGEGAVVGARSSVFKDVKPWSVVAGNPARFIKKRILSKVK